MKLRVELDLESGIDALHALIDEAIANDAYDEAVCSVESRGPNNEITGWCIGENHIETCPVLIAWQDRKAASEKRRGMR